MYLQVVAAGSWQPTLDDLIPARHIGLFPAFIDVLVDEQHPPVPGQQSSQQLPELLEPARRRFGSSPLLWVRLILRRLNWIYAALLPS